VTGHDVALSFVGLGVAVAIASAVGALVMGTDSFNRLHFVTPITSVAGPLVAVGLCIQRGWGMTAGTILLVVGLLFIAGPVTAAATGRLMAQTEGTVDPEAPR
jgi:multicomponent Na+:H+ antiporter subunit G